MSKRIIDIGLATFGLLFLSPILALISLGIALTMGRPILFAQYRVGQGGEEFQLKKFRTMREALGPDGSLLPDEDRVTVFGLFLRRTRLDELPELWLVLVGVMSFVGPRPLPGHYLDEFGVRQVRSSISPGLTGLSQVSGNTLLSQEEKFAIDLLYIDTRTTMLDCWIIYKTMVVVFAGEKRDTMIIDKAKNYAKRIDRRS